jgi:glycosyltransferase involved in cell wall biosynthesis
MRKLYAGVKWADIFVSSFIWNPYTVVGIILCKLFDKKLIVWEELSVIRPGLVPAMKYAMVRGLVKRVNAFFVLGKVQENILERLGVSHEKIFLANEYPGRIYHGVEQREVPRVLINRGGKVILYVGRLVDFKGVDYLIKAFSSIEQEFDGVNLVIAGDGPFRSHLEALAASIGVRNVLFLGRVTDAEKAYLLAKSSMLVAPTICTKTSSESTGPMTVLEALSAGKPVITTTVAGSSVFIQNGVNGFVVREKDADAIAEKIRYLLGRRIPESQVLATFRTIKGVEYQVEQFEKAINYVTRDDGKGCRP